MTVLEATAAFDEEWTKLQQILPWDESQVTSKAEVIRKAELEGKKVHFVTLMDLCRLKIFEWENKFRKYKGRVVFRSDLGNAIPGTTPYLRSKVLQRHT